MADSRINRARASRGGLGPFNGAGAPAAFTNEVQRLTIGGVGAGSKFRLTHKGQETADITWSATTNTLVGNIDAALEALSGIGTGGVDTANVDLASGLGHVDVTFRKANAGQDVPLMTARVTAGALTVAVAEQVKGVAATAQGAAVGALYIDTTNAVPYINVGTKAEPFWVRLARKIGQGAFGHADTAGGVIAWQNPEVNAIVVEAVEVYVSTVATGACSIDVGVAANGTTTADNLIDGLDVHSATGAFGVRSQAGANGIPPQLVPVGGWVTGSKDTGAAAGLVGQFYVTYHTV